MLILASKSPRRKAFLEQLGLIFSCENADIDETPIFNELPAKYVERLAINKAKVIAKGRVERHVLGSDTSVVVDGRILGKPQDLADSIEMLSLLSGRKHQVLTAVALVNGNKTWSTVVETVVEFCQFSEQEIIDYWHTGEPQDKAGSYALQGIAGQYIKGIEGSYSAVIGLPLYETVELLKQSGIYSSIKAGVSS